MENAVIISDHAQMDRVIKEERQYILNIIKQIKKTSCNVLLIQKSILRDAISDLAIHYLAKMKILIVKDVEREDVPFIAKVVERLSHLLLMPSGNCHCRHWVANPSPVWITSNRTCWALLISSKKSPQDLIKLSRYERVPLDRH